MNITRAASAGAVTVATIAAGWATSTAASATSIIGFGNAALSNFCSNVGGSHSAGETTRGPGTVTGLVALVPLSGPTNQCGNLGLPTKAADPSDVCGAVVLNLTSVLAGEAEC